MNIFLDFFRLFFPKNCLGCSGNLAGNEAFICNECFLHLPQTNSYAPHQFSEAAEVFYGKVNVSHACAYLYFTKQGIVQELLHQLKYRGERNLGVFLGEIFGTELAKHSYYQDIDAVVPVPLHAARHKKRGYNQSEEIAKGIAQVLGKPILPNALVRVQQTETQTKKTRFKRWENINEKFQLAESEQLENKHILLVDDVITTGATMEACAGKLLEIDGVKVSIAGLAVAIG